MKIGLVMEGGSMRGMYTAGVIDVLMENDIEFDGAVGVSAGAAFGCNYKSHQIGRAIRYNMRFCRDERYVGIKSLIKTGDLYGNDFCYKVIPEKLDIFDAETFKASPMEFYVTCTDALTGKPVYHKCENGDYKDLQWIRASAAMPVVSNVVEIDGMLLSDGGTADSIPAEFFKSIGYTKNVVILTQPEGFIKKKNPLLPIVKAAVKKYPEIGNALAVRHEMYNKELKYIKEHEKKGELFVIKPSEPIKVKMIERRPEKLKEVYMLGRSDAEKQLSKIKSFICK